MARTKREIAAKLFEAGLFNHPIYATLCHNSYVPSDDHRHHYVEVYIREDTMRAGHTSHKLDTLFRFFVTMEEWEKKIFIPNQGLTPGQVMRMIEQFWDKRVCGPDPWGIKK